MSETTTPVSKDSPLWLAWEAYTATEEYANTKRWAVVPEHAEGSLWAAFERGFAAQSTPAPVAGKADEMPEAVFVQIHEARVFTARSILAGNADRRAIIWLADDRERLLARVAELERSERNWQAAARGLEEYGRTHEESCARLTDALDRAQRERDEALRQNANYRRMLALDVVTDPLCGRASLPSPEPKP